VIVYFSFLPFFFLSGFSLVPEEELRRRFSEFGEIGDIYLPKDSKNHLLANFAIIRFVHEEDRNAALASPTLSFAYSSSPTRLRADRSALSLSPLRPQKSYFSSGTGYHGICNLAIDDGTYHREESPLVEQDISLASCRSRSGYPWGSVRELKYLAPHPPSEATFAYPMRIDDLPRYVT
jgi:hypothetical protein